MRSPNWHECEVMLAMDLYLNKDLKWINRMSDSTFEIIALSKILNALDFYSEKPDNFRSTGSIRMKLANFMALDERYQKNSLDNVGALDKSTWKKYSKQKEELHRVCVFYLIDVNTLLIDDKLAAVGDTSQMEPLACACCYLVFILCENIYKCLTHSTIASNEHVDIFVW